MSSEADRYLQELLRKETAEKQNKDARPGIEESARKEYASIPDIIRQQVTKFNESDSAKATGSVLRIEGPVSRSDGEQFLFRFLRNGAAKRDGRILVIGLSGFNKLDENAFTITFWQNTLSLRALEVGPSAAGYAPSEHPRKLQSTKYKAVQIDNIFVWEGENSKQWESTSFTKLFENLIGQMVKANI